MTLATIAVSDLCVSTDDLDTHRRAHQAEAIKLQSDFTDTGTCSDHGMFYRRQQATALWAAALHI